MIIRIISYVELEDNKFHPDSVKEVQEILSDVVAEYLADLDSQGKLKFTDKTKIALSRRSKTGDGGTVSFLSRKEVLERLRTKK